MQPVITLLPPSVFVFVFVFVLRTKGNLYCLKGYALVPVTLNGKSGYLHCALNIFIGAWVFVFTAGYPLETIDPCPLVNIYPNTHTQTE